MNNIYNNFKLSGITFLSRLVSGSVIFIVLVRLMAISEFGLLSFGTTLAGLIIVIAEYGYSILAQKDIPQDKFEFKSYVYNSFLQKTVYSLLAAMVGIVYLLIFFTDDNLAVGLVFIATAIITSNIMYLLSIFRAKNLFRTESLSALLYSIIMVGIVLVYFIYPFSIIYLAYSMMFARIVQLIYLGNQFHKNYVISNLRVDFTVQIYLFKNSFLYGMHYILGIFYLTIDNQIIAYYLGNDSLALYQAMFKLVFIMFGVSEIIINVFLPYLSSIYSKNVKNFRKTVETSNNLAIYVGLFLFVFFNITAYHLVKTLYTEKYLAALTITIPLGFILLFRTIFSTYFIVLSISNHRNILVWSGLISLMINITLNIIFIPTYGYIAAAYVSMLTHLVLFGLYSLFTLNYFGSFFIKAKSVILMFFSFALVFVFYWMNKENSIWLSLIFGVFWLTISISMFTKNDIKSIKSIFADRF